MAKRGMTYADAGVDIDLKSRSISALVEKLGRSRKGGFAPLDLPGHFTGLIDFGEYALSLCTDGVGTKLIVAEKLGVWNTVGIDCIAMNVNDTICVGAEPVAFVDYIAVDRPMPEILAQIGEGLQKGAELSNMAIVGGEVAIMPEVVRGIDLTGTCLGIVKKEDMIIGSKCAPGDRIVGLASSGIHSNGLSLARKIIDENGLEYEDRIEGLERRIGEELLVPTKIYVEEVLRLVRKYPVHGMINITGGGMRNFLRLREGLGFSLEAPMQPQPVFTALQELGSVDDREMYQTFNMGMGFAIVAPESSADSIVDELEGLAKIVGKVDDSGSVTMPSLGLEYDRY
ncbi:MAG TPA: phosphoribosylformylglycinamidine cyclo-ligase [Euryarchaeota archaeon]|nr:phosphoribosylformylglycinamidine cyclo-ligase [Euryarchaeota archaeon]